MRINRTSASLVMALAVAACATPEKPRAPVHRPPEARPTPTYSISGLQGVIGRTAKLVEGLFGRPDIDVREGSARRLQYSGAACVLDVYLYPPAGGGEPIVTYLDARQPDGRDFDRASCVAALAQGQHK